MKYKEMNPALLNTFEEKVKFYLGYLYEDGGNEYKETSFSADRWYQSAGCYTPKEFMRIMKALESKGWVTYKRYPVQHPYSYTEVLLTDAGIKEIEKGLPRNPMIGLVNQEINTGEPATDAKIAHAKNLFFAEPKSMNNMRSACETLSFVIEPLRKDLKGMLSVADVETFFAIVNNFDIRHNKHSTARLTHSEQLEWVFYSLLNTINLYSKLKNKLST